VPRKSTQRLVEKTYPSEKYAKGSWDDDIPNSFWKVSQNSMVPVTTKQKKGPTGVIHHGW